MEKFTSVTDTKEAAALMAAGVKFSPNFGTPVTRVFDEIHPYKPTNPDGGGNLIWMLRSVSETGHKTSALRLAWMDAEKADKELDDYVETLPADIKAVLRSLIPKAQMAAIRVGMYNWTALADMAKKAVRKICFRSGNRVNIVDLEYSKGTADKFGLPYPNPVLKR